MRKLVYRIFEIESKEVTMGGGNSYRGVDGNYSETIDVLTRITDYESVEKAVQHITNVDILYNAFSNTESKNVYTILPVYINVS